MRFFAGLAFASMLLACNAGTPEPERTADESRAADAAGLVGQDAEVSGTGGGLNLRAQPSRSAQILEVMADGTRLHVTSDAMNGYVGVDVSDGRSGFAWAGYLTAVAPPPPPPPDPAPAGSLQAAVDQLAAEVGARSPGTDLAIAVRNLTHDEYAGTNDDVTHVSASSAKAMWAAAALHAVPIDRVAPYADAVFSRSDNYAAGSMIDLVGPNAENDFYQLAGMTSSGFTQWSFGRTRVATNSPRAMGWDNYFTARDVVTFLANVDGRQLLGDDATSALESWMTLSPRTGYGGWLGSLLPAEASRTMMHKGGWLPPGCCSNDAYYKTLNEIGIIQVPNGDRYAVAIFTRRGADFWGAQAPFVEHASCVLYRAVAGDSSLDCR